MDFFGMDPDSFSIGLLIGASLVAFFFFVLRLNYRSILQQCAEQKTAEKLPDGKFYYIVTEEEYNKLGQMRNQLEAMKLGKH